MYPRLAPPILAAAATLAAGSTCYAQATGNAARVALAASAASSIPAGDMIAVAATGTGVAISRGSYASVQHGDNPIDPVRTFNCGSPRGCLFTIASDIFINGTGQAYSICSYVDGQQAQPYCQPQADFTGTSLQSVFNVAPGNHTFQTRLEVQGGNGTLQSFQIVYTLYGK